MSGTPAWPMPVIVGCPRSGTTLLRFMLDASPLLAIPPETGFLVPLAQLTGVGEQLRQSAFNIITQFPPDSPAWPDFQLSKKALLAAWDAIEPFQVRDGVRTFYQLYATRQGKPRWGEKTPYYGEHLQAIEQLLPEARFIHLIRDGRDVALSLRQQWFAPGKDMETLADYWRHFVTTTRQQGSMCRWYKEIRYETLILKPRPTLEAICAFLELPFTTAMERFHEHAPRRLQEHGARINVHGAEVLSRQSRQRQQQATTQPLDRQRVSRWKATMTADERRRFETNAAPLLRELGYEIEAT